MTYRASSRVRAAFALSMIAPSLGACLGGGHIAEGGYRTAARPSSTESIPQGGSYRASGDSIKSVPVVQRHYDPGSMTSTDHYLGNTLIIGHAPREIRKCTMNVPVFGGIMFDSVTGRALSPMQVATQTRATRCPGYPNYATPW